MAPHEQYEGHVMSLHGHHRIPLYWHWVESLHSVKLENGDVKMSPEPPSTT